MLKLNLMLLKEQYLTVLLNTEMVTLHLQWLRKKTQIVYCLQPKDVLLLLFQHCYCRQYD